MQIAITIGITTVLAAEERKLKLQLEQVRQRVVENVADIQAMGATS